MAGINVSISELGDDATPQLGGSLDVNGNAITTTETDGNITLTPDGTGKIVASSDIVFDEATADLTLAAADQTSAAIATLPNLGGTNGNIVLDNLTQTFTNKTFDANATGNSLSNVDVADLANGTDGELITWDATGASATVAVGSAGQVLTSNGVGAAPTFQAGGGGGINNVVEDTTPQLGGNLDVNGNSIVSVSSGNITLAPNGTGDVVITSNIVFDEATNDLTLAAADQTVGVSTATIPNLAGVSGNIVIDNATQTFTNKTFDANGTGNSLSNVDVADLANGTDGELITWDAAGAPATVAVGTAAQVLTSNGVGAAPTFQAAATVPNAVYALLSSSVNQNPSDTNPTAITYNTQDDISTGLTHSTSTDAGEITIDTAGIYTVTAQPQVGKLSGGTGLIFDMFLQVDRGSGFADETNSNVKLTVKDADITDVIILSINIKLNATEKVRIMQRISATAGTLGIKATAAETGPPTIPATPSIIFTMARIGGF